MTKNLGAPVTDVEAALAAANALVHLLPSDRPLSVRPEPEPDPAQPAGAGVVATFVGASAAELAVLVGQSVDLALEGAGGASVSLADALRPALEAATATLGIGVLSDVRLGDASDVGRLGADGGQVFALEADGEVQGWFAIRIRSERPKPRAEAAPGQGRVASMRMLYDVEMTLTAEIGRARLPVRQVLDLVPGAVIELDRVAGSPADLMVNGRLIARGEVVVIDEDYGLRITEIVEQGEASA